MSDATAEPPDRRPFATFRIRILPAAILALGGIGIAYVGGIVFLAAVAVLSMVMAYEFGRMIGGGALHASGTLGVIVMGAVGAAMAIWTAPLAVIVSVVGSVAVLAFASALRQRPGWAAGGILYIALACVGMIWLRTSVEGGFGTVLWLFVVVWATDSGAYVAGNMIGGPRLALNLSPNKTRAGALGGAAAATLIGVALAWLLGGIGELATAPDLSLVALGSLVISLFAQAGDLLESATKRRFGVKDTGALIPGHGGALDRLDSLSAAALVTALATLAAGTSPLAWMWP